MISTSNQDDTISINQISQPHMNYLIDKRSSMYKLLNSGHGYNMPSLNSPMCSNEYMEDLFNQKLACPKNGELRHKNAEVTYDIYEIVIILKTSLPDNKYVKTLKLNQLPSKNWIESLCFTMLPHHKMFQTPLNKIPMLALPKHMKTEHLETVVHSTKKRGKGFRWKNAYNLAKEKERITMLSKIEIKIRLLNR